MAIKNIAVIDTGAGNLFSLCACLKRLGLNPNIVKEASEISSQSEEYYQAIIIPGQGRFGNVMKRLKTSGLSEEIKSWYLRGKTVVGICVGMQILFEWSEEDLEVKGLGLFKGKVTKLKSPKQPMVGWCSLTSNYTYLADRDVYFVNSYAVKSSKLATSMVSYGEDFVSSIKSKGLTAFQFHPEKSGVAGEDILKKCLIQN